MTHAISQNFFSVNIIYMYFPTEKYKRATSQVLLIV